MIKIKTALLQDMLDKAMKVAKIKDNDIAPLSSLLEITVDNNIFYIRATDGVNNLIVKSPIEGENDNTRIVVDTKVLPLLIPKMTTEYIELNISENSLTIVGNGVYYLDIRIDENGDIIKFPKLEYDVSKANKEISFTELAQKLSTCSPAIPDNLDNKELNNFYIKDRIIATNAFIITSIAGEEGINENAIYVGEDLGRQIISLNFDKAKYYVENDKIYFVGDNFILSGEVNNDSSKRYPLDAILSTVNIPLNNSAKIDRNELLNLIERLSLFVSEYDDNSVQVTFKKDRMTIFTKKNSSEDIMYKEANVDNLIEFTCKIHINHLKAQLSSLENEVVTIEFGGSDQVVKLIDTDVVQVISLMLENE